MALHEIQTKALALDPEERLRLIDALSESLTSDPDVFGLSDEQKAELDRRIEESDRNPETLISLDEVIRRLSNRS